MTDQDLLQVRELSKAYINVKALKDVSLALHTGEIHGIVGENGAGKSTLMRVLSGRIAPDHGAIILDGEEVTFRRPGDAIAHGIAMVPQELAEFSHLTVAENLFVGKMGGRHLGLYDRRQVLASARKSLEEFDLDIDPALPVNRLSTGYRQILQIMRTLSIAPRILILDEPTSSLDVNEAQDLFRILRGLNEKGVAIFYISHHLRELFGFVHTVTVLRDGSAVGTRRIEEVTEDELVRMMVGREVQDLYATNVPGSEGARFGDVCLEASGLSSGRRFRDVSFTLRSGEILGFFGLIGAGRTELFKTILGVYRADSGSVDYFGRPLRLRGMRAAVQNSIGYVPEDRKQAGLFVDLAVNENLIAPQMPRFSRRLGVLNRRRIDEFAERSMKEMNIAARSMHSAVARLSGGNQQKVLLGMWTGIGPKVLIVDEPTKGVDIATKQMIYLRLRELANEGVGIVLISSDLPEVVHLSDRIIVMREGRLAGEIPHGEVATEEKVMKLAVGVEQRGGQEGYHA